MGKKTRREREEKRDNYATQHSKKHIKNMLIGGAIAAVIVAILGVSVYNFTNIAANDPGAPLNAGSLGDAHEHSSVLVRIFGDKFDFSKSIYQVSSNWIHFEAQDGTTIHRHATGVTLGYLFETLEITLDDECYIFPDEREFCTNEDYALKFFINHQQVPSITDYVLSEQDKILIVYGNETSGVIEDYLIELDGMKVLG